PDARNGPVASDERVDVDVLRQARASEEESQRRPALHRMLVPARPSARKKRTAAQKMEHLYGMSRRKHRCLYCDMLPLTSTLRYVAEARSVYLRRRAPINLGQLADDHVRHPLLLLREQREDVARLRLRVRAAVTIEDLVEVVGPLVELGQVLPEIVGIGERPVPHRKSPRQECIARLRVEASLVPGDPPERPALGPQHAH